MNLLALLRSPITWCAAAALAAILAVGAIFHRGEKAGAADVTA